MQPWPGWEKQKGRVNGRKQLLSHRHTIPCWMWLYLNFIFSLVGKWWNFSISVFFFKEWPSKYPNLEVYFSFLPLFKPIKTYIKYMEAMVTQNTLKSPFILKQTYRVRKHRFGPDWEAGGQTWLALALTFPAARSFSTTLMWSGFSTAERAASMMGV